MAIVTCFRSASFSGFNTDTFFIPGQAGAQALPRTMTGGGTSVVVEFPTLSLRITYSGVGLTFAGTTPTGGTITGITVAQVSLSGVTETVIGTLAVNAGGGWSFADIFTPALAAAYRAEANRITGTGATDTLIGGDEADLFLTGGGNDIIRGGAGADVLQLSTEGPAGTVPASSTHAVNMGWGVDTLRVVTAVADTAANLRDTVLVSFEAIDLVGGAVLVLDADDLGTAFPEAMAVTSDGGMLQFHQLANQPFSVARLQVTGDLRVRVVGTAAGDVQLGNAATRDILDGGASGDSLRGLGGDDSLIGGAGNDTLDGGTGADVMTGGADDDLYIVGAGDVIVETAGGGTDLVRAYAHHVLEEDVEHIQAFATTGLRLTGNALDNQIGGNAGADLLRGEAGNDVIAAGEGNDTVTGGLGDDILNGQSGHDAIRGDAGNDRLIGNLGNDTVTGGEGADVFVFRTGDGVDRIRDFATNGDVRDVIDLSGLAAVTDWADLVANHMVQQGLNVVITAGADQLVLERVWLPLLEASDFLF